MNLYKTYKKCISHLYDFAIKFVWKNEAVSQFNSVKRNYKNWQKLSNNQKKQIAEYWCIKHPNKSDFITHEIMLNVKGEFDVKYCPESVFRLKFDDDVFYKPWTDKNYCERFLPDVPVAHTFVRNIGGCLLDFNYQPITTEQAKKIIADNLPLIVKPSLLSGQGKNIKLISSPEQINGIFTDYDRDYLVQEYIIQSDTLSKISPHSVASARLITAMVNGKPAVLKKHLLGNTTNTVAVNSGENSGSGVVIIKIDDDCRLDSVGYYENADKFYTLPNGFSFAGTKLEGFEKAISIALEAHKTVPMLDFIGWDITLDKDNNPVFIEWNLRNLEVFHSQLTQGPLFGEYADYFVKKLRK